MVAEGGLFAYLLLLLCVTTVAESDANATKIMIGKTEKDPILEYSSEGEFQVPAEERTILRFVFDFALEFKLSDVIIFAPYPLGLLQYYSTGIYEYFNGRGIYISIHSTRQTPSLRYFHHNRHRLGVVVVWEPEIDDFLDEVSNMDVFGEDRSWLFIRREAYKGMNITYKLAELNIRLQSNALLCRLERQVVPTRASTTSTTTEDDDLRYYEVGEKVCVPENRDEDWYKGICVTGSALPQRIRRETSIDPETVVTVHQIYKVPGFDDDLVEIYLGFWDPANGLKNSKRLIPVERRLPIRPFKIVIGTRNATVEGLTANALPADENEDQEMYMHEFLECLLYDLPARREIQNFAKLGYRNEEGTWTSLLGAVVEGTVDFALDTMSTKTDTGNEMTLSLPIVAAMNNIYFRRPDSGGMRDIFLAPFSANLLVSVLGTVVLLALSMILITAICEKMNSEDEVPAKKESKKKEGKEWVLSEAALWSVSVICMQGSPWSPSSKSGSFLLVSALLFALVMYNAYAAFITSVLSVKTTRIKTLEDLIQSDYSFGYTLGTPDEMFLRTVNNSLLRELYFKGLRQNDGVKDPLAGMLRVGEGHYAFFVAARTARRALRKEVAHNQRCGVQELTLTMTNANAAIPISRYSSFKKAINFRILRMKETGLMKRFQTMILPKMPKCVERNRFNSARFADVYSAFYIIVFGWILSSVLLAGEILWHSRKSIRRKGKAKILGRHDIQRPSGEEESRRELDGDGALVDVGTVAEYAVVPITKEISPIRFKCKT